MEEIDRICCLDCGNKIMNIIDFLSETHCRHKFTWGNNLINEYIHKIITNLIVEILIMIKTFNKKKGKLFLIEKENQIFLNKNGIGKGLVNYHQRKVAKIEKYIEEMKLDLLNHIYELKKITNKYPVSKFAKKFAIYIETIEKTHLAETIEFSLMKSTQKRIIIIVGFISVGLLLKYCILPEMEKCEYKLFTNKSRETAIASCINSDEIYYFSTKARLYRKKLENKYSEPELIDHFENFEKMKTVKFAYLNNALYFVFEENTSLQTVCRKFDIKNNNLITIPSFQLLLDEFVVISHNESHIICIESSHFAKNIIHKLDILDIENGWQSIKINCDSFALSGPALVFPFEIRIFNIRHDENNLISEYEEICLDLINLKAYKQVSEFTKLKSNDASSNFTMINGFLFYYSFDGKITVIDTKRMKSKHNFVHK